MFDLRRIRYGAPNCPRTGTITAWKRLYVEKDRIRWHSFSTTTLHLNDAVGIITNPANPMTDFFLSDDRYVKSLYDTMFVEVEDAPQAVTEVPHEAIYDTTENLPMVHTAVKWFHNANRTAGQPIASFPNHFSIIGGSEIPDVVSNNPCSASAILGQAFLANDRMNVIWMWSARIERLVTQANLRKCGGVTLPNPSLGLVAAKVNGETVVHEIAHQFDVNNQPPPNRTAGHCDQMRFQSQNLFCSMNSVSNRHRWATTWSVSIRLHRSLRASI